MAGHPTTHLVVDALEPEVELMLCCARLDVAGVRRGRLVALLAAGIDWQRALVLASRQGLLPLLHRHLSSLPDPDVPRAVRVELWGYYEASKRRFRAMSDELVSVVSLLQSRGLRCVPYKGPALAVSLYGDPALREFGDLDILLASADIIPAKHALMERGYRVEYALTPALEDAFLRASHYYHLVMVHAESDVMVELHWKTDAEFPIGSLADERWWSALHCVELPGGTVRTFPDAELLLVLCLHGSKHHWGALGWLVDVAQLAPRLSPGDWEWLVDKATKGLVARRRVALGLRLAAELLQAELPADVALWVSSTQGMDAPFARVIIGLLQEPQDNMPVRQRLSFQLAICDSTGQRLRHFNTVVLKPTLAEWVRWPLPRFLYFIYPPLRLCKLTLKYAARLLSG